MVSCIYQVGFTLIYVTLSGLTAAVCEGLLTVLNTEPNWYRPIETQMESLTDNLSGAEVHVVHGLFTLLLFYQSTKLSDASCADCMYKLYQL